MWGIGGYYVKTGWQGEGYIGVIVGEAAEFGYPLAQGIDNCNGYFFLVFGEKVEGKFA